MATRFYFESEYTFAEMAAMAFDSSWELTTSGFRNRLTRTKRRSAFASSTRSETSAAVVDVLDGSWVSDPLQAQSISGNVKGIMRALESNIAADMRAQLLIKVVSYDGATVRGTLLAHDVSALSNEFATTLTNRKFPLNWSGAGAVLSSVSALDGDRIVVELGVRAHNVVTTSYSFTVEFGTASSSDCDENETDTLQYCPWIEFDQTLLFWAGDTFVRRKDEPLFSLAGMPKQTRLEGPQAIILPSVLGHGTSDSLVTRRPDYMTAPTVTGGGTVYYKMRARDSGASPPGYVTWVVQGVPDLAGAGYPGASPTPVGAMVPGSVVVASAWEGS